LQSLRFPHPPAAELVAIAREESEASRKQGFLKPFLVEKLSGSG
jgi:hypothetical protein